MENIRKKYEHYVIKEPLEKGPLSPIMHFCAEDGCAGAKFLHFPAELASVLIAEPHTINPKPHAHDYDQFLCFLGSNNRNLF